MRRTLLIIIVFIANCCSHLSEGLRILVISPLNMKSHDAMTNGLARGLAARGHQIDIYSHYPPKNPIANYHHHSLAGTIIPLTNNVNFSDTMTMSVGRPREIFKRIAEPLCDLMGLPVFEQLLKNPPRDPAYDLVILEMSVTDCYLAWARYLDVPLIGITSMAMLDWLNQALANPFNTAVNPAYGTQFHTPMNFWQRLYNTIWSSYTMYAFNSFFDEQSRYVERFFGTGYPGIADMRRDLDLLIVNSHHSLDGIKAYPPAVVPVAGLHIFTEDAHTKLSSQITQWLDDSEHGCVYFTLGSMVRFETFPKPVIDAFYESFRRIAPVRVLMKVAKPKDLPAGLPSNVLNQSWFPQIQVFRHKNVKAFITHGGLMSSIEAINARIPMIGVPIFSDQYQNVKANVRRGISTEVQIDSITADELTQAINDVLHKSSYQENIDKLWAKFIDRPMKPLDTAIYWVEYVGRHGKKCLRSPLVDMPWWQANLLDVYVFLLSTLFLIYYLFKFSIRKIWCMFCARKHQSSSRMLELRKKQP